MSKLPISTELTNWPECDEFDDVDSNDDLLEWEILQLSEKLFFDSTTEFEEHPLYGLLNGNPDMFVSRSYDPDNNLLAVCVHLHHELNYMGNPLGSALVNLHEDFVSAEFIWDAV